MREAFVDSLLKRAAELRKRVVFPDATDERTVLAALTLLRRKIASPILVGPKTDIEKKAAAMGLPLDGVEIVEPSGSPFLADFAGEFFRLRKSKGMTEAGAAERMRDPLVFAAMMIHQGLADAGVAGSLSTTADVLRAGIQVVGLRKGVSTVSSSFLMIFPETVYSFADCGVVPDPTAEELAHIGIATALNHTLLTGQQAKVAFLSFATKGSAGHVRIEKVRLATEIAKRERPDMLFDGELQLDAAIRPEIGRRKAPGSPVAGEANVLVFPDLDAGNIGYKIAQHMGGATALGPIVQGLAKPLLDLSRGCSADDIALVAAISSILSAGTGDPG